MGRGFSPRLVDSKDERSVSSPRDFTSALLFSGCSNGFFPVKPEGFHFPGREVIEVLEATHGDLLGVNFLDWPLWKHPEMGRYGKIPGLSLAAQFSTYRKGGEMRRRILDEAKSRILVARESSDVLYLVGHSFGATIIYDALNELVQEGRISHKESKYLYLLLFAPAAGPIFHGLVSPSIQRGVFEGAMSAVDGAAEMIVEGDPLAAYTVPFHPYREKGLVVCHSFPSLRSDPTGTLGHIRVGQVAQNFALALLKEWARARGEEGSVNRYVG